MNHNQRWILSACVLLMALSLVIPPWKRHHKFAGDAVSERAGYRPIFSPPWAMPPDVQLSPTDMLRLSPEGRARATSANAIIGLMEFNGGLVIDWELLRLQLLAIALATVAAVLMAGSFVGRKPNMKGESSP